MNRHFEFIKIYKLNLPPSLVVSHQNPAISSNVELVNNLVECPASAGLERSL